MLSRVANRLPARAVRQLSGGGSQAEHIEGAPPPRRLPCTCAAPAPRSPTCPRAYCVRIVACSLADCVSRPACAVMEKWKKISYVGMPCIALFAGFCMYKHYSHHHEPEEPTPYPHMHIRTKPFPWGSKDCDLFDFDCKKAQREQQQE